MSHPYRDPDVEPKPIIVSDEDFRRAIEETGTTAALTFFVYVPIFALLISGWFLAIKHFIYLLIKG